MKVARNRCTPLTGTAVPPHPAGLAGRIVKAGLITLTRHDLRYPDGRKLFVYGHPPSDVHFASTNDEPAILERRFDRLTGTWVAVAASRNGRPGASSQGCPLCPGGLEIPFDYDAAVFENRFPTFSPRPPMPIRDDLRAASSGRCEVVVYSPHHVGSLATLAVEDVARTIAIWRERSDELWADPEHSFVMIFENHGEDTGATLSHPHGQIYAFPHLPPLVAAKVEAIDRYRSTEPGCLHCRITDEDDEGPRTVIVSPSFVTAVPFAARWPYEVHVRARRHGLRRLGDMTVDEARDLVRLIRLVARRYNNLFGFDLPFMLCVQEAPHGIDDWHLHIEFLPPHRSRDRLKLRASVETATGLFINDTEPERTAAEMRALQIGDEDIRGVMVPEIVRATSDPWG